MFTSLDDITAYLRVRLAQPLPGLAAQLTMAPAMRPIITLQEAEAIPCRSAAVLVLLIGLPDGPAVVLTRRTQELNHHGGQISFPGGHVEPGEEPVEAALREAWEEIGCPVGEVEILGQLTPLYIPVSNYCVQPFVGVMPSPRAFKASASEVYQILTPTLAALTDPANRNAEVWQVRGASVRVPSYDIADYRIWGATAMMLSELIAVLQEA